MTILFDWLSQSVAAFAGENRGVCLQEFPSFPSPFPLFHFLALVSFLARPKPVFPCSETKWKRLLRRLISPAPGITVVSREIQDNVYAQFGG